MSEQTFVNNDFADVMLNRKSVRRFDPEFKIDREEIKEMIAQACSAPSACNLQSWHFVIVDQASGKEKLKDVTMPFNYPQLETASAIVFVLGDTHSHKVYREVWTKYCQEGRISEEKLQEVFSTFLPLYENASREFLEKDATLDGAMVAMQLLLVARGHGYEANAWAGYKAADLVAALDKDSQRYIPIMAISIGKADETPMDSARYDTESLISVLD